MVRAVIGKVHLYISIAFSSRLQTIHSPEAESVCIVPYTYARFGHSLPILFCFLWYTMWVHCWLHGSTDRHGIREKTKNKPILIHWYVWHRFSYYPVWCVTVCFGGVVVLCSLWSRWKDKRKTNIVPHTIACTTKSIRLACNIIRMQSHQVLCGMLL